MTLARAAVLYATMDLLHVLDHVRQGRDIPDGVLVLGVIAIVLTLTLVVLAVRRHPAAAPLGVVLGGGLALGFAAVHLLPDWGVFSQSYEDLNVDALSWLLAIVPMFAAVLLALTAAREMRATAPE
jgi:hypothetical protein